MTGSVAEERIRAKVEALMRRRWPDARIVHELMLEQGGVRIDLAAITPDRLVVAEVKSERDVLKRTARQIGRALEVADEVWFCFAERHAEAVRGRLLPYYVRGEGAELIANTERVSGLRRCAVLMERSAEAELVRWPDGQEHEGWPDPKERFLLLWADEMRSALGRHFGGATIPGTSAKLTRHYMTRLAVEHMTGREVRRTVCEQLRERQFPRADAPASFAEATRAA